MAAECDPHAELRAKILMESLVETNKPAWGYFGIPAPLAIGDNSYAPRLTRKPPDEDAGDPITNIKAAPLKKGSAPDVYFQFAPSIFVGGGPDLPKKEKIKMLGEDDGLRFKPAGSVKAYESTNKLGYLYEEHCDSVKDPKAVKEKYTDYVPPRQIYSGPTKKGGGGVLTQGVLFGYDEERNALPEHMADDYDASKKLRKKELDEHQALLQETPFKCGDYGNKAFHPVTDVYHYEVPTHIPRDPEVNVVNSFPHEQAFKPANPMKRGIAPVGGQSGLMGGIPEHVPEGPPQPKVRQPKDEADDKMPFRLGNARQVCNPMPSITTNLRNMRCERPSSFSRPVL